MPDQTVVLAQTASVTYRRLTNPTSSIKDFAFQLLSGKVRYDTFSALKDVSFRVRQGEILGVIGRNGAGKSTLLKLLARIYPPTSGRIVVRGTLAPMIELGVGFDPELTGSENILLYGTFLGGDSEALKKRIGPIAEWAGLEEFLDVPLRRYSSGMMARLAFAVAAESRPDVLLIDEVLAVGDESFQARSYERIQELLHGGAAVVLVSHALDAMTGMTNRILWLEAGRTMACGNPASIVHGYRKHFNELGKEAISVAGR